MDEFTALRSKMYAFKCGNGIKKKLKGISKSRSKQIKFQEYYNSLFGGESQKECNIYFLRSIIHEMHLQEIKKINIISI